jgi:hypothetical protein
MAAIFGANSTTEDVLEAIAAYRAAFNAIEQTETLRKSNLGVASANVNNENAAASLSRDP